MAMRIEYSIDVGQGRGGGGDDSDDDDGEEDEDEAVDAASIDEDTLLLMQKFEADIMSKVSIGGVPGVNNATIVAISDGAREGEPTRIYVAETDGTNLLETLAHPDVDSTRTVSNDIHEMTRSSGSRPRGSPSSTSSTAWSRAPTPTSTSTTSSCWPTR